MIYQRILLTRLKFIGDIVLTTPIIKTVRQAFPHAHIAFLGEKNAVELLEHNPYLNEIIPLESAKSSLFDSVKLMKLLYSKKFDLAVDFFGNPRSALLTFATRAKVRIGLDVRGRGAVYTIRVPRDNRNKNAIQFYYEVIRHAGIDGDEQKTEIFLSEDEKNNAKTYLENLGVLSGKKIIALHPGGTWPSKLWQKEKFAALAQRLRLEGANVILTGGRNDKEVVDLVAETSGAIPILNISLRKLAAILSLASVVVSNDCGTMHIAAATGATTIGIFGPGEPHIWFPYTQPHVALIKYVPCNPCHLNICNRTGDGYMECMKLLSVDEVYTAVKERLNV